MSRSAWPTRRPRERAFVCGLILPAQPVESSGPLAEIRGLLEAADAEVVGEGMVQFRPVPVASTLFGRGKVDEIGRAAASCNADAVVVDNDLSPAQVRNLEKAWGRRVVDRSEVILDIFARRAKSLQAKLQVELAQVEYLFPRLRRMWTHLERTEGAIGTRGPGETQLETDRRLIRRRIQDLRAELARIASRRQREVRSRSDQFTVGLVGYTNAGKSTLLNRLTGAHEFVADMPFATLDTRTRQWKLPDGRVVLLSDTVGFLQRLPHHLVASFHATLEETLAADLLLHVVDASHQDVVVQIQAVESVLEELSATARAGVLVFNKIDRLTGSLQPELLAMGQDQEVVEVSAKTGVGLEKLVRIVVARLDQRSSLVDLTFALADGRTASAVRRTGGLQCQEAIDGDRMRARLRLSPGALGRLRSEVAGSDVTFDVVEPARLPLVSDACWDSVAEPGLPRVL
jgi:GTP-binding protein HflX